MPECFAVVYDGLVIDKELRLIAPADAIGARARCFHNSPTIAAELVNGFAAKTGKEAKIMLVEAAISFLPLPEERHTKLLTVAAQRGAGDFEPPAFMKRK